MPWAARHWRIRHPAHPAELPDAADRATDVRVRLRGIGEAVSVFLGLGAPPDQPSWGILIADGRGYIREAPWLTIIPGCTIAATAIGLLNLIGDGLRDVPDPRIAHRAALRGIKCTPTDGRSHSVCAANRDTPRDRQRRRSNRQRRLAITDPRRHRCRPDRLGRRGNAGTRRGRDHRRSGHVGSWDSAH